MAKDGSVRFVVPEVTALQRAYEEGRLQGSRRVICPGCEEEGERSTVERRYCRTTTMAVSVWYDEDGQEHREDPNTETCTYRCSGGHTFTLKR